MRRPALSRATCSQFPLAMEQAVGLLLWEVATVVMYECIAPAMQTCRQGMAVVQHLCVVEVAVFVRQVVAYRLVLDLGALVVVWRLALQTLVRLVASAELCRSHRAVPPQATLVRCRS